LTAQYAEEITLMTKMTMMTNCRRHGLQAISEDVSVCNVLTHSAH